jgi:mono/diheme cytochrome c family protein
MTRSLAAIFVLLSSAAFAQDPDAVGEDLFLTYCASCHGEDATMGAPGDIRGLPHATLVRALRGVEEMPEFSFFSDEEVEALAVWLGMNPLPQ